MSGIQRKKRASTQYRVLRTILTLDPRRGSRLERRSPVENDGVSFVRCRTLAEECYRLTANFPRDEIYGMTSQIRRSSVSIPANIAEGHGRENTGSFIQFLRIAQGSLKELETHLILAQRVALATAEHVAPLQSKIERTGKMLRSLIRVLQEKQ